MTNIIVSESFSWGCCEDCKHTDDSGCVYADYQVEDELIVNVSLEDVEIKCGLWESTDCQKGESDA